MEKAEEIIERIEKLQKESAETMDKLKRSLAIQKLWPEITFPCTSHIEGSAGKGFKFVITSKTGEVKKFELNEIPEVLKTGEIKRGLDFARRWSK